MNRTGSDHTDTPATDDAVPRTSRRRLLRLAGATVAGTAAGATIAGRAAAETGYTTGGAVLVGDAVLQQQNLFQAGKSAFVFATKASSGSTIASNASFYPGALAGWAFDNAAPTGVYGYTDRSGGAGVVGLSNSAFSPGVIGKVEGSPANSIGVHGEGNIGVHGQGSYTGVHAQGTDVGVHALGAVAVFAAGEASGLVAVASDPDGIAVEAISEGPTSRGVVASGEQAGVEARSAGVGVYAAAGGVGVLGESLQGVGVAGKGAGGALQARVANSAAPPARVTAFERGVLDIDANGDLWYCYQAGTPGKWRKLGGGGTAGAFHPLTPGRVYDSREALPASGVLTNGANRTISVADRRNPAGGAVTLANFVPAGATAVAANVTVVSVVGPGVLAVNPGGVTSTDTSTINWNTNGQVVANGVILTLNATRQLTAVCYGGGSAHFIIDISGYYL